MARWVWAGAMLVLFLGFWLWYGGAGTPVSAEEGAQRIARIRAAYAAAGQGGTHSESLPALEAMIARDDGREFYMVNLETARKTPEAQEADEAYARVVLPALLKRGGYPVYVGKPIGAMLGQAVVKIDRVAIVRYRSLRDLLDMVEDPAMIAAVPFKFQSLEHTEAFPTAPVFTAVHVRLSAGIILGMIALLGWVILSFRRPKSAA